MSAALDALQGETPRMVTIREDLARLLGHPSMAGRLPPILILGETGTGKGLLARTSTRPGRVAPPLRGHQLRRHPRDPARGRAVRLRARGLHRRPPGQGRPVPSRARRHAVPRRDRAPSGGAAGQAAHRPRGPRGAPAGQHPDRAGRRGRAGGDERRPPARRRRASVPRGSLSSARGHQLELPPLRVRGPDILHSPTTSWPGPAPTTACRPAR